MYLTTLPRAVLARRSHEVLVWGCAVAILAAVVVAWVKNALGDVAGVCTVIGAACAVLGLAVNTWCRLPELHRSWRWIRGRPVAPIEPRE